MRNVLLLSTAADLSLRLLQNAGRYVQGAMLAPGFYADPGDARARDFVAPTGPPTARTRTPPRRTPSTGSTRCAPRRGRRPDPRRFLRALSAGTFEGLTGALHFSPDHGRVDPPRIYVVDGEEIRTHAAPERTRAPDGSGNVECGTLM